MRWSTTVEHCTIILDCKQLLSLCNLSVLLLFENLRDLSGHAYIGTGTRSMRGTPTLRAACGAAAPYAHRGSGVWLGRHHFPDQPEEDSDCRYGQDPIAFAALAHCALHCGSCYYILRMSASSCRTRAQSVTMQVCTFTIGECTQYVDKEHALLATSLKARIALHLGSADAASVCSSGRAL